MAGKAGGTPPKKDILDILREAEEQNHADMDVNLSGRKPEMEKTKLAAEEETYEGYKTYKCRNGRAYRSIQHL